MELMVPWYIMVVDTLLFIAIGYALVFFYKRLEEYDEELKVLIRYSFLFLLLAEIGRVLDLMDDFCCHYTFLPFEGVLYLVTIIGVIYTVIRYITLVELRYMPSVALDAGSLSKSKPKTLQKSSPFTVGAYIVFSKYRLADVIELVREGEFPLMAVTRSPSLYESFDRGNIEVVWVTQVPTGVRPTALHVIQDQIIQFVQKHPGAVVVIDSIEYLLLYNDFKTVFKFLVNLKDYMVALGGTLIVFVDDTMITPQEKSFLLKEFEPL
jgi:hypothetical protein